MTIEQDTFEYITAGDDTDVVDYSINKQKLRVSHESYGYKYEEASNKEQCTCNRK